VNEVGKNVLGVYATKSGSTADVARLIADILCRAWVQIEVEPVHAAENTYVHL
jgi:menaquinone-dependent protoporphyrinogen IX oxidase